MLIHVQRAKKLEQCFYEQDFLDCTKCERYR